MQNNISINSIDQISNVIFSLFFMHLYKTVESPAINQLCIYIFYALNTLYLPILFFLYRKISAVNFTEKICIEKNDLFTSQKIELTKSQYDRQEFFKILKSVGIQVLIVTFLNWKFSAIQPVFLNIFNFFKQFFLNPLYKCYFYNRDIKRPYELNMLFAEKVVAMEKRKEE